MKKNKESMSFTCFFVQILNVEFIKRMLFSAQLKSQRSYDSHTVRSRTETIPEHATNGHPTSGTGHSRLVQIYTIYLFGIL